MGWITVSVKQSSPLFSVLPNNPRFYFTHSYYFKPSSNKAILAKVTHGNDFAAVVQKEHIFGVQFHPVKSHKFGLALLSGFVGFHA